MEGVTCHEKANNGLFLSYSSRECGDAFARWVKITQLAFHIKHLNLWAAVAGGRGEIQLSFLSQAEQCTRPRQPFGEVPIM